MPLHVAVIQGWVKAGYDRQAIEDWIFSIKDRAEFHYWRGRNKRTADIVEGLEHVGVLIEYPTEVQDIKQVFVVDRYEEPTVVLHWNTAVALGESRQVAFHTINVSC